MPLLTSSADAPRFHIDDDLESQQQSVDVELAASSNAAGQFVIHLPPHERDTDHMAAPPSKAESTGLLSPTKMMRGRSYSSHHDAAAATGPTVDSCFTADYLRTPLLHDSAATEKAQHLFGTPPPRLHLSWNHIDLFVPAPTPTDPNAKRKILTNCSGRAFPGETVAIMGPSGSGKTSLLSLLAGGWRKARESGNMNGEILVNDKPATKRMKRWMAYIEQDDVMFSNLTVEQTLRYSALLNLPKELTRAEKLDRVAQTIDLVSLSKCRSTRIGGAFTRGVSGGERKRTSVATEMLGNPSIITADEPTSGLDSTTAARLITTFRTLARGGRTVLCSIHQPSSQMFDLFDKVILLAQGRMIFYGSTTQVTDYFASTGLMCKPHFNPSDFMLELCNDLTHDAIATEEAMIESELKGKSGHAVNGAANGDTHDHADPSNGHTDAHLIESEERRPTASTLLAASMPEASFDTHGTSADRIIRRLPFTFAQIGPQLLELEDSLRTEQQRADDRLSAGEKSLPLSTAEQALADDALDGESRSDRWPLSWCEQFTLLLSRSFLQYRGEMVSKMYAIQVIGIALVASLVWFQVSHMAWLHGPVMQVRSAGPS
jgi:ABC-type multidrug transport system ATPase subunit